MKANNMQIVNKYFSLSIAPVRSRGEASVINKKYIE
jgi:hypothetical protein